MRKILMMSFALCNALLLQAAKVNKEVTIKVGKESRKYWLYVPTNIKDNCPFVLSLHGAGGHDTDKSPFRTDVADKAGCIVAYPQGKDTSFPGLGGMTAPGWSSYGEENFDTDFLKAVIEDVATKYKIDRQRLYCCGFSNGGMMTYTMANTNSQIFAAFAAISGYPINEFHLHHTSARPVPFLHIHGKNDDFVKYSLVPNVIDNMVARNGANPVPQKTVKSGKYTKSIYEAGEGGFPIIYYEIDGMGHSPFTNSTEKNSSSQTMWDFFQQYTLDSPCDKTLRWRPRIETEGYNPKSHGWTMNSGTTLLRFGGTQNTSTNQNVYRSLQFQTGSYKLCFKSTGEPSATVGVKIEKLTGKKNAVLDATVNVGEEASLPFEVADGWGEYKITFTRPTKDDAITVTDIAIYAVEDTPDAVMAPKTGASALGAVYSLSGVKYEKTPVGKGVYIANGKKVVVR